MIKLSSRSKREILELFKYTKISRFTARLSSPKSRNDILLKIFLGHETRLTKKIIIILIGVSGCGKTTIGRLLVGNLSWSFYEGDEFQPQSNMEKMRQGIPLNDDDRIPWLERLRQLTDELVRRGEMAIVACSVLKSFIRTFLWG